MAGAEEVVAGIERREGTEYSGLVLNERGYERFAAAGLDRVNVTLGATEEFNRRNGNASLDEAVARVEQILAAAQVPATVTISVAFGCPFEGRVDPGRVAELAGRFDGAEVVLADTIGVAAPREVRVAGRAHGRGRLPRAQHAQHGLRERAGRGRGGRDRARRVGRRPRRLPVRAARSGNVATEDLAYLLEHEGIETGVDLDALIAHLDLARGDLRPEARGPALPGRRLSSGVSERLDG